MKQILLLDAKNYDPALPEIRRACARGIIFIGGKLLLIEDSFGSVKLPGGRIEPNEDAPAALIREVREETGYEVLPDTVVPFGEIEEKRLSVHESAIWHQTSLLYFCETAPDPGETAYTENEKKYGFKRILLPLEEAIARNKKRLEREGLQPWNAREYQTLLAIRAHLEKRG